MPRPLPRSAVALMSSYHSPQVDVDVRLNTNESPEPPPRAFIDALARSVTQTDFHRYPDRSATELRQRIATYHEVEPSQVFCANGSNEVLQTLLLTFAGSGRRVGVFEPTYAMHSHIARVIGTEVVVGDRTDDFEVGDDELDRLLASGLDVLFLCSPNNPTGGFEASARIAEVTDRVTDAGGLLVVDEAYGQFTPDSAIPLVNEVSNLVVTRTYSKTWAMAGTRLGFAIAPSWLVEELDKVVLPYHLDHLTQVAGCLALDHLEEMEGRVRRLVAGRERLASGLAVLPVTVWRSGANFILFRPDGRSGDEVWNALVAQGVLVRNCASWPGLTDCLRVTVGTPDENDRFLATLGAILGT